LKIKRDIHFLKGQSLKGNSAANSRLNISGQKDETVNNIK